MRRRSLKKRRSIKKYGGCNDFITHFNTIMNTIKNVEPENIKVPICEFSNFKPEGEYPTNRELKYVLPFKIGNYVGQINRSYSLGTYANVPIVNLYRNNNIIRFGTKISLTEDNAINFQEDVVGTIIDSIQSIQNSNKRIICISLLTHCESIACDLGKFVSSKIGIVEIEKEILKKEIDYNNENQTDIAFISFPFSSSKKFVKLFDYEEQKMNILNNQKEGITKEILKDFYNLIDISSPKKMFRSIVNITELFHFKYSKYYDLAFHCKSGLDRTSMMDTVVNATMYCIRKNGKIDYSLIRNYSKKFMIYNYLISFVARGYFGIKLNSNKGLAMYIFGEKLYNYYLGKSNYF